MININKVKTNAQTAVRRVGRRKTAVARVRLTDGKEIVINNKPLNQYFSYFELRDIVLAPLKAVGQENKLGFTIKVVGGGVKGQAQAICLGIARTLARYDEDLRKILKTNGHLTRDARIKERKKPGLRKARRAPQWKKR